MLQKDGQFVNLINTGVSSVATEGWIVRTLLVVHVNFDLIFGVLTPHSEIFQLYHGDQF